MSNSSGPDRQSSGKKPIQQNEWVAIIVAFLSIGTIFAWSLTHTDRGGIRWPDVSTDPRYLWGSANSASSSGGYLMSPSASLPVPSPVDSLVTQPDVGEETPTPEDSGATAKTPADEKLASSVSPVTKTPVPSQTSAEIGLPLTKQPKTLAPTDSTTESPETPAPTDSDRDRGVKFKDVPDDFWAFPFITALVERDLFDRAADTDIFQPNAPMTRAEYAVALQKAFKQNPTQNQLNFQDVPGDYPAGEPIKRSTETGFLRGYPGQIFQPNQPMPRVQVIVSLANGLGLKAPSNPNQILQRYQDADRLPAYSVSAVAAATKAGLVVNYPNPSRLNPNQDATRADVASLIHRALVIQGKVPAIPSEYIVQPD